MDEYKRLCGGEVKTGQTADGPRPDKRGGMTRIFLLWTAGIIIGGFALMQFMLYMMFRPEYPITRADRRSVIEYCGNKYGGKAVIKKAEAIQYGVDRTRFDEYTVGMDDDVFHVNVSVMGTDYGQAGGDGPNKSIMGDDRQLEEIRDAMVELVLGRTNLPEPDRVVFYVSSAVGDKYSSSIRMYYDGGNIEDVYNEEGINAAFLYRDIDLSKYGRLRHILPYDSGSGDYFGNLDVCREKNPEDFRYSHDNERVIEALRFSTEFNGKNRIETVGIWKNMDTNLKKARIVNSRSL